MAGQLCAMCFHCNNNNNDNDTVTTDLTEAQSPVLQVVTLHPLLQLQLMMNLQASLMLLLFVE
jgi:hypothetical protein